MIHSTATLYHIPNIRSLEIWIHISDRFATLIYYFPATQFPSRSGFYVISINNINFSWWPNFLNVTGKPRLIFDLESNSYIISLKKLTQRFTNSYWDTFHDIRTAFKKQRIKANFKEVDKKFFSKKKNHETIWPNFQIFKFFSSDKNAEIILKIHWNIYIISVLLYFS
jgi:hypothetical protein